MARCHVHRINAHRHARTLRRIRKSTHFSSFCTRLKKAGLAILACAATERELCRNDGAGAKKKRKERGLFREDLVKSTKRVLNRPNTVALKLPGSASGKWANNRSPTASEAGDTSDANEIGTRFRNTQRGTRANMTQNEKSRETLFYRG